MKLKRFLLRYEPPGIGLEVMEDDGKVVLHHKALPAAEKVNSSKEIHVLADDLIGGESALLSRKKHRAALIQLLGRLYQIEVEAEDDAGKESDAPTSPTSPASNGGGEPQLKEGQQVVLIALTGKLQPNNGELATLTKINREKGRYEVMVNDKELKVKGSEHIVPCAAKGTPLTVGTHVAIRGLRNHLELNGCLGRIVESHDESHRFEVRATYSGQLFRVKQENLVPIDPTAQAVVAAAKENRDPNTNLTPRLKKDVSNNGGATSSATGPGQEGSVASITAAGGDGIEETFEPGSLVQLVGLKTAMCYNGQTAEVLSVDRIRCRYEIRLNDGSVKTIRAENVRLVSGMPKSSPRSRRHKDGSSKSPERTKPAA